jgi:hypothetical protein
MKLEIQNDLYPFRDSWIGQLLMVTHEFDIEKDDLGFIRILTRK